VERLSTRTAATGTVLRLLQTISEIASIWQLKRLSDTYVFNGAIQIVVVVVFLMMMMMLLSGLSVIFIVLLLSIGHVA